MKIFQDIFQTYSRLNDFLHRVEDDTNKREDEKLRDDKERKIARDNGAVEVWTRNRALETGKPAHDDGQKPSEECTDSRW